MAPKKTTTKKQPTKVVTERPPKDEKKKWRVQCKAGLLTYNNPKIGNKCPFAFLEKMKEELTVKFPDTEKSLCVEFASRMHVHLFFEGDSPMDCDLQYFQTSESGEVGDIQNNRGKNIAQGHYYCQCTWKDSYIAHLFDVQKTVCGDWLMNLWKANPCKVEKIEEALAAEKLLVPRFQQQIRAVQNHNEKIRIEKMMVERAERMKAKLKKFALIVEVQLWLEQYLEEQLRYTFLVLCGPSKLRKTEYAKSLFKNPFVHKDKLDWDGYSWEGNDAIIFDDVNLPDHIWKFVRQNKVLFQASGVVAVNTSATNCFKRNICVVQKPIVICTNDGLIESLVSKEYREWIESNSVWLNVDRPIAFEEEYPVAWPNVFQLQYMPERLRQPDVPLSFS